MFLDPIGECDICGDTAYFGDGQTYCMEHSHLMNEVDVEEVVRIADRLAKIDGVDETSVQPLAFIGAVTSESEIPWEVHEFADENDYRVSEKELMQGGQFVLEPKDARIPYTEVEDMI